MEKIIRTVCILTAGKGSRMGPFSSIINKSLLPIYDKAIISHLINHFPKGTKFVIALGYNGYQIRNYLELMHDETNFKFINVDNFEKEGSGPAYSLQCCKSELQEPFFFIASDGFYKRIPLDLNSNWLGVSNSNHNEKNYCNIGFNKETKIVCKIFDKILPPKNSEIEFKAFNGLMFIKDFNIFWDALNINQNDNEQQISQGFTQLINNSLLKTVELEWSDLGTLDNYSKNLNLDFDFSKLNEFIYFSEKKIVKFFYDETTTTKRVSKAKLNPKVFPKNITQKGQFYSYDKVIGDIVYKHVNEKGMHNLLKWLSINLWEKKEVDQTKFIQICELFYIKKTKQRIKLFKTKYPDFEDEKKINGNIVKPVIDLLKKLPKNITNGVPVFMHGDLHFDNMITNNNIDFSLIDWRQDFGGEISYGDWYYDLAKMLGGIEMNYDYIKLGLMNYQENEKNIWFDFAVRKSSKQLSAIMKDFIISQGLDFKKVKLIQGLIYLNMAPLHHAPFDKLLYCLSKEILTNELE